jgi:two-component sensor histidine kinase
VTNSLKHAFPQGKGTITVSLDRVEDGSVALVVSDNGRGRSVGDIAQLSRSGIGTSIINGLVSQLQGTTIMGNEQGARTEIRVAAPVLS